jgi:hypothetical protein
MPRQMTQSSSRGDTDPMAPKTKESRLLTERQVAAILQIKPNTLAHWRLTKLKPLPFIRIGRTIRYHSEDVEQFLAKGRVDWQPGRTLPGGERRCG